MRGGRRREDPSRRGWEPASPSPRATKIQQPKIFPHSNKTSPNTFPAQKPLPTSPQTKPEPPPGFFGPNPGQFGSKVGYFGSLLGRFRTFPGQNRAVFAPIPPPRSPLRPGRCAKTSPSSPFARTHLLHPLFPEIAQNNTILSQITPNLPLSVYR